MDADLRHAELIVEQLKFQSGNPVVTPEVDAEVNCVVWDVETEEDELPAAESTGFRAIAARRNDLQPDRLDIQCVVKEVCR